MSPVLSFSVLYMQLCLRELHHAIHALMVVSHSRCQLLQRATARTAADAGGVWDTPATALGLPAGCLHQDGGHNEEEPPRRRLSGPSPAAPRFALPALSPLPLSVLR